MKILKRVITIIGLCIIDQLIKIVIDHRFMTSRLEIEHIFGFHPKMNTQQLSIFNNELGLDLGLGVLNVINIIAMVLMITFYVYLKRNYSDKRLVDPAMILFTSGIVCSLIDKICWGGSLDYILFFRQISDLKDIYLLAGAVLIILFIIRQGIEDSKAKRQNKADRS
ncbi:signal peptidase II [uncultured Ruminococcus sp.]|uniref:signal peptidase II n=1 Tax=uncultured Ruminococcus sp. TaxID=165186 RepID=UPI0025D903A0|nr:signal peptidase II [uncultured Ruminococcus sp.]